MTPEEVIVYRQTGKWRFRQIFRDQLQLEALKRQQEGDTSEVKVSADVPADQGI